ncbi:MAG TPA: patatin-like phospholipase family protein, partial [Alphaproteobacteria bacterium]|nr:patatin-like phospholipase family protein [Alphaproteobacteria bacterium]
MNTNSEIGKTGPAPRGSHPRPRPVSTVAGALWDELESIHGQHDGRATGRGPDADLQAFYAAAIGKDQAAVCLSGGGIRSASFALGVLQALSRQGLLAKFHYLSTVSGGGYIGGWLMAMLQGYGGDALRVQEKLRSPEAPAEIRRLRQYTNYLAPGTGLFSPDIWAGVTLWVRNVLINWLIFFPAFLALALAPLFYADVIHTLRPGWFATLLLFVALLGLGLAVYNGGDLLPSHVAPEEREREAGRTSVPLRVVLPHTIWVALVPVVAGPWLRPVMPDGALSGDAIPLLAFLVMECTGFAAGWRRGLRKRLLLHNLAAWTVAALASSVLLWLWLDLALGLAAERIGLVAVLGPLAVASSHLVLTLVFVALRTEARRGDLDREWLARLSGEKILPPVIWALFAAVCLLLPAFLLPHLEAGLSQSLIWLWLTAGPIAAYIGKVSRDMPGADPGRSGFKPSLALVTDAIALLFGICLFMLLAVLAARLTGRAPFADLIAIAFLLLLAWALGRRINVNRFSMHAVYRARLVRGFVGSVRTDRNPDVFTGIDPLDNPRLVGLFDRGEGPRTLFPVINATLNVVSTRNAAWKERKAESFTMTPLACGGAYLRRSEDAAAGYGPRGAYVRTADYAGDELRDGNRQRDGGTGLSLGTAM